MLLYVNGSRHILSLVVRKLKSDSYNNKVVVLLLVSRGKATHQGLLRDLKVIVNSFLKTMENALVVKIVRIPMIMRN